MYNRKYLRRTHIIRRYSRNVYYFSAKRQWQIGTQNNHTIMKPGKYTSWNKRCTAPIPKRQNSINTITIIFWYHRHEPNIIYLHHIAFYSRNNSRNISYSGSAFDKRNTKRISFRNQNRNLLQPVTEKRSWISAIDIHKRRTAMRFGHRYQNKKQYRFRSLIQNKRKRSLFAGDFFPNHTYFSLITYRDFLRNTNSSATHPYR